jgi:hypothetical protein
MTAAWPNEQEVIFKRQPANPLDSTGLSRPRQEIESDHSPEATNA